MAGQPITESTQTAIDTHIAEVQSAYTKFDELKTKAEAKEQSIQDSKKAWADDNDALEAVLEWTDVPEDPANEEIAAMIVYSNIEPDAINYLENCPDLFERINAKLGEWAETDPKKSQEIQEIAQNELMKFASAERELMGIAQEMQMTAMSNMAVASLLQDKPFLDSIVIPPAEEGGEWSVAAFFISKDEDGNVISPETLDFDVSLSAQVSSTKPGLSDIFNVAAYGVPAGQKVEPYVVNVKKEDGHDYKVNIGINILADGHLEVGNIVEPVEEQQPINPMMQMMQQMMM